MIGVRGIAATPAQKLGLRSTVLLTGMPTLPTLARGVVGSDLHDVDPRQRGFVDQKHLQLGKAPGVQHRSLIPPSPDPRADAGQLFDRKGALRASAVLNDLLGNLVIGVGGKPLFFAGELLQFAFRGPSAELLQFGAQPAMAMADMIDRRTGL